MDLGKVVNILKGEVILEGDIGIVYSPFGIYITVKDKGCFHTYMDEFLHFDMCGM